MSSTVTQRVGGVLAEELGEQFDVFDEHHTPLGHTVLRSDVHKQGLWHRAVYCWLFDTAGRVLLQQRSDGKTVGPGQWDLSVAEHLQPGEAFRDAAVRGLEEELGIHLPGKPPALASQREGALQEPQQLPADEPEAPAAHEACTTADGAVCVSLLPIAPSHARRLDLPEQGIHDYEFVESYVVRGYEGPIDYNVHEVQSVAWVELPALQRRLAESPLSFTSWLREEFALLASLGALP